MRSRSTGLTSRRSPRPPSSSGRPRPSCCPPAPGSTGSPAAPPSPSSRSCGPWSCWSRWSRWFSLVSLVSRTPQETRLHFEHLQNIQNLQPFTSTISGKKITITYDVRDCMHDGKEICVLTKEILRWSLTSSEPSLLICLILFHPSAPPSPPILALSHLNIRIDELVGPSWFS